MNAYRKMLFSSPLPLMVAAWLMTSPGLKAGETPRSDSAEVSDLLVLVEEEAAELKHDAMHMESFTRSKVSLPTHSDSITQIAGHVNNAGRLLAQLQDARDLGSPWQQQAIDRVTPLMQQLASHIESTIKQLNEDPDTVLHTVEFRQQLVANYDLAVRVSDRIGNFMDYGRAKRQLDTLGSQLSLK